MANPSKRKGDRETVDGVVYVTMACRRCYAWVSVAEAARQINGIKWQPLCGKCAR